MTQKTPDPGRPTQDGGTSLQSAGAFAVSDLSGDRPGQVVSAIPAVLAAG